MKKIFTLVTFITSGFFGYDANAQTPLTAQPIPDRTVSYIVTDAGTAKPITWGLDLAWLSEGNLRRGMAFMGADRVDLIRSSFTPTAPLNNGELPANELAILNQRLDLISLVRPNMSVVLNCDHPSVDAWYSGNASRWAQLIDVTTRLHQERGYTVVTVSPFNEPDYGWGQGTNADFYNIAGELRLNSRFNNIRISGGNTLNCDQALPWYNFLKARLDEGNTHQLAGTFDNFASFYQTVRANGDHATGDELHNVMEAMVGAEYGMQTGIWWGTAELARGEFVKASDGVRIGYAEHRPYWSAASVYRGIDGKVQAFGGTSERQAVQTTYRFVSRDRAVYYDGYGPQREYTMVMPGGTGYQSGQTNAERVVNITWGDDIQPAINGRYVLVNRSSGKVMEVAGGATAAGAVVQQGTNTGATYQQWNVTPVDSRIGGDFSYFTFTAVHSGKAPDILNWSLDNGAGIIAWDDTKGGNQQWYLDYGQDGWFYIRSRHSAKCIDIGTDGVSMAQWDKNGNTSQQWRFLPVGATVEFVAPAAPTNVTSTANAESVRLTWTASSSSDVSGYTIFRSTVSGGPYNTIARNVTGTTFVDNTATTGGPFYYVIRAVDQSLNRSSYSNQVSATPTGAKDLVSHYKFDGNTTDNSVNLNHAATYGTTSYTTGKVSNGIVLNGSNAFVQLPADVANQQTITVAAWVYWSGGSAWQRIFDFGNDESANMFLTPSSGSGQLRFGIKNGGAEQGLNATALTTNVWTHVAVTLSTTGARLYVNGAVVAESTSVTVRPIDFKPVLNYIGRSQYPDPLFNGRIDEFRVYNYALTPIEIANLGSSVSYYQLKNRATGLFLDGMGRTTNGSTVGQYGATNHINSHWDVVDAGNGYYQLQNRATSLFIDGVGYTTNGSVASQYAATTHVNSQWYLEQFDGTYYRIQNRATGMYLDGMGRTTNGADAAQWANTSSTNSQWEFINTSTSSPVMREEGLVEEISDVAAYPNPVEKTLTIRGVEQSNARARIINISGQVVKSIVVGKSDEALDVQGLPGGIYFIEITVDNKTTRYRLIKK